MEYLVVQKLLHLQYSSLTPDGKTGSDINVNSGPNCQLTFSLAQLTWSANSIGGFG